MERPLTRRRVAQVVATLAGSTLLPAFEHAPTAEVSEGPAYKPNAPVRTNLINPGTPGQRFVLHGTVLSSTTDKPLANAMLDLWNVRNDGTYDMSGFNLRGRQLSSKQGGFEFLTIEAIPYGSRTAHFHIKVSAPGYKPLTTELYIPELAQNQRDSSFRTSNLVQLSHSGGIRKGRYQFYLRPI